MSLQFNRGKNSCVRSEGAQSCFWSYFYFVFFFFFLFYIHFLPWLFYTKTFNCYPWCLVPRHCRPPLNRTRNGCSSGKKMKSSSSFRWVQFFFFPLNLSFPSALLMQSPLINQQRSRYLSPTQLLTFLISLKISVHWKRSIHSNTHTQKSLSLSLVICLKITFATHKGKLIEEAVILDSPRTVIRDILLT